MSVAMSAMRCWSDWKEPIGTAEPLAFFDVDDEVIEARAGRSRASSRRRDQALNIEPGHQLGPGRLTWPRTASAGASTSVREASPTRPAHRLDWYDLEALGVARDPDPRHALVLVGRASSAADDENAATDGGVGAEDLLAVERSLWVSQMLSARVDRLSLFLSGSVIAIASTRAGGDAPEAHPPPAPRCRSAWSRAGRN